MMNYHIIDTITSARMATQNIFTYGSLMYPQVMYGLVTKKDYKTVPALLHNYTRLQVKNRSYPGLTSAQGKKVKGVLYLDMIASDVQILHNFQGYEYKVHEVVVVGDGGQEYKALAYLYGDPCNLESKEWDVENFQKNHKANFVFSHIASK